MAGANLGAKARGEESAATIEVDGKRIALTPEGIRTIRGTTEEVRRKVGRALAAAHDTC